MGDEPVAHGPYTEAKRYRVLARLATDRHEATHYKRLAVDAERARSKAPR